MPARRFGTVRPRVQIPGPRPKSEFKPYIAGCTKSDKATVACSSRVVVSNRLRFVRRPICVGAFDRFGGLNRLAGYPHWCVSGAIGPSPSNLPARPIALRSIKARVVFGEPIQPVGDDPHNLTAVAFQRITDLMPAYREEPGRKLLHRQLTNLF